MQLEGLDAQKGFGCGVLLHIRAMINNGVPALKACVLVDKDANPYIDGYNLRLIEKSVNT